MHAGRAQVVQPLQVPAFALPVADGEVNKIKLRNAPEIGDGKYRHEDRLQPRVVPLIGQLVHLQETLIGAPLHFNQVGNLGCGGNF